LQVALSDTGIPKVNVSLNAETDGEPEFDISDEDILQFDTSSVSVIVILTKVCVFIFPLSNFYASVPRRNN
jgi:exosome complex component RRP42